MRAIHGFRDAAMLALLAGAVGLGAAPSGSAAADLNKGRVETVTVHSRALEGNLMGESPDREVAVYLPPSYIKERTRRFPVVILLHGYSLTDKYWIGGTAEGARGIDTPGAMDRDIASGKSREMILVMPDGNSKYDGSMYSSSVTSGDWEGFIADDLVEYIDSHYRTLSNRDSRGLAGHSMGGYGAIRIGMKRPDAFSALYVLSACCLMNDPVSLAQRLRSAPADSGAGNAPRRNAFPNVLNAEAAAWSPNPKKPPSYFDLPGDDGVDTALLAHKWAANSPLVMLDQYVGNLKLYSAIAIDVGRQDTLAASNEQLANALSANGVNHTFETYEGDHVNHIADRVEQNVLPFFSSHLKFFTGLKLGKH